MLTRVAFVNKDPTDGSLVEATEIFVTKKAVTGLGCKGCVMLMESWKHSASYHCPYCSIVVLISGPLLHLPGLNLSSQHEYLRSKSELSLPA